MSSPGAETTGEGAMQAFPSPVIGYFLFPDWHVGSIVAHAGVEWGEGRSVKGVGGLVGLEILLEGCAGSFAGHGLRLRGIHSGWRFHVVSFQTSQGYHNGVTGTAHPVRYQK